MNWKTSDVSDACALSQVCELDFGNYGRRGYFCGSIRTVHCIDGLSAIRSVLETPGKNQVLVIDGEHLPHLALFGDVMGELAVRHGWEGIVVNGLVRDRDELGRMDLGVKALGTVPRRANPIGNGEIDVLLRFGNVTFTPGARIIADSDGVVVLPRGVTDSDLKSLLTCADVQREPSPPSHEVFAS